MSRPTLRLFVELEDGKTWEVDADQRDYAAWEMQTFYDPARNTVLRRFLAFSASSRLKLTDLSWAKFNAQAVMVDVESVDEPADPTQPGTSAGN